MKKINVNYYNKRLSIPIALSLNEFKKVIQTYFSIPDTEMEKLKLKGYIGIEKIEFELNDTMYDDFIKNDNSVCEISVFSSEIEKEKQYKEILDLINPMINSLKIKCSNLEEELKTIKKEFNEYKKDKGEKIDSLYKYFFENQNLFQTNFAHKKNNEYLKSSSFTLFKNSKIYNYNNQQKINQNINEQENNDYNLLNNYLYENNDNNNLYYNNQVNQYNLNIYKNEVLENKDNEIKEEDEKEEDEDEIIKNESILSGFYNEFLSDKKNEKKQNEKKEKKEEEKKEEEKKEEEKKEDEINKNESILSGFYNEFLKDN